MVAAGAAKAALPNQRARVGAGFEFYQLQAHPSVNS
jgi:hypothetical protein